MSGEKVGRSRAGDPRGGYGGGGGLEGLDGRSRLQADPVERTVFCAACGYAGTADRIGMVAGRLTLGDYKTDGALSPEHMLQLVAYRHAAAQQGLPTTAGLIVRLPKTLADPEFEFETMWVPDAVSMEPFLAALRGSGDGSAGPRASRWAPPRRGPARSGQHEASVNCRVFCAISESASPIKSRPLVL